MIELIVTTGLVGVVLLALITMFISGHTVFKDVSGQILDQYKVNLAMEYIIKGVREAGGVDIGTTFGVANPVNGTISETLITSYIDASPPEGISVGDERYKYWRVGDNFIRETQVYTHTGWTANKIEEITQISNISFAYCVGTGVEVRIISEKGKTLNTRIPFSY